MGQNRKAAFTSLVSTPSRHPANENAYDALAQRYAPSYVQPQFWLVKPTAIASPPAFGEAVTNVTFTVEGVGFPFRETHTISSPTRTDADAGQES